MKLRLFLSAFAISIPTFFMAQEAALDTVSMDMMVAPNSPAFNLLGLTPALIDKPSSPNEFAFSIANTSNSFSQLPKNYAVEFLPIPLLFSKAKAGKDLTGKGFKNTLAQTFSISTAFTTNDTVSVTLPNYIKTQTGIGFKVSFLRGKIDREDSVYIASLITVKKKLDLLHKANVFEFSEAADADIVYALLKDKKKQVVADLIKVRLNDTMDKEEKQLLDDSLSKVDAMLNKSIALRIEEIKTGVIKKTESEAQQLKAAIEQIKFRRYGPMLDLAGAMVLGYRNDEFQNSVVQKYAFWLNGGVAMKNGWDILALARVTTNIKSLSDTLGVLSDETIFDCGAKLEYITPNNKFSIAGEFISRFVSDTSIYRYTINTSYQVKKNQAITLSVGKDFGSTKTNTSGSLIAMLNYVVSFGSTRRIYK